MKKKAQLSEKGKKKAASSAPARSKSEPLAKNKHIPIIGVGASAGGLEALEIFLSHTPTTAGLAIVIVQHQDPDHKGALIEILQRSTSMPVAMITDHMSIELNSVYVIPPNNDLSILHDKLLLLEPDAPRGLRLPIDTFFTALAIDRKAESIGVVLSGMGSDGTQGLKAIKGNSGLTFAQDPASARFDGMPTSAIGEGVVDVVAETEDLPNRIIAVIGQAGRLSAGLLLENTDVGNILFDKIASVLRARTGHDFSLYKKATVYRRIERRMVANEIDILHDYLRLMQHRPEESDLLLKELLIGVTSFFRDSKAWISMREKVVNVLVTARQTLEPVRVWMPGCASGEEAYSLAILFHEALPESQRGRKNLLQIFATDLDEYAINTARIGVYPDGIVDSVSPERLEKYFVRVEGGYRVKTIIRQSIVFATQNLIMDPPFTRLDLVVCRNLLIYLTPVLQQKVLSIFHYSLNPNGFLFLGGAETNSSAKTLFEVVDGPSRIYYRSGQANIEVTERAFPIPHTHIMPIKAVTSMTGLVEHSIQKETDKILLRELSPPAVLTDSSGDIAYISGSTGKYLEPVSGTVNWNLSVMVREEMQLDLNDAFRRALRSNTAVSSKPTLVDPDSGERVIITVRKLTTPEVLRGMVLTVFETVPVDPAAKNDGISQAPDGNLNEAAGEENLKNQEQLNLYREEMQTFQEEARSASEELQSTNEELQSTNEELTTSREEMQSMNEELQTLNQEMKVKLEDLTQSNSDLINLMENTEIATVFLDTDLKVRLFTAGACELFRLIPSDVGRTFSDIQSDFEEQDIAKAALKVMDTLAPFDNTIQASDNRWYQVRMAPYHSMDRRVEGVVLTFSDVTTAKQLEEALRVTQGGLEDELVSAKAKAKAKEALAEPIKPSKEKPS
jgi:chemotaxis methyl-accepting protein methylase